MLHLTGYFYGRERRHDMGEKALLLGDQREDFGEDGNREKGLVRSMQQKVEFIQIRKKGRIYSIKYIQPFFCLLIGLDLVLKTFLLTNFFICLFRTNFVDEF